VDFNGANLNGADLKGANLSGAVFFKTDVSEARLHETTFSDVDLSNVQGLDTICHSGPSTLGIDTLYRSKGNIPEVFLHGCGVPRSLVANPIEFYSAFISYSGRDQAFAERLHADLRAKDLRVWFAPEDLKIGDRFQERIEDSIRLYDKVIIILSKASVASRWVEREVNAAREREDRENRTVLFPIRLDETVMDTNTPWAADIRRARHIGDFTGWKEHDMYTNALERLLRDLRQEEGDWALRNSNLLR
jgi:hypothetical protein